MGLSGGPGSGVTWTTQRGGFASEGHSIRDCDRFPRSATWWRSFSEFSRMGHSLSLSAGLLCPALPLAELNRADGFVRSPRHLPRDLVGAMVRHFGGVLIRFLSCRSRERKIMLKALTALFAVVMLVAAAGFAFRSAVADPTALSQACVCGSWEAACACCSGGDCVCEACGCAGCDSAACCEATAPTGAACCATTADASTAKTCGTPKACCAELSESSALVAE